MAVSDVVVSNLTALYVAVAVYVKAYGLSYGRSFGGCFVVIVSMMVVGLILMGTLAWDISRKLAYVNFPGDDRRPHEVCKGGICWHDVARLSPAPQFHLRLPEHIPNANAGA